MAGEGYSPHVCARYAEICKELAAALGVSTRTVDRWIQEQTGPPATLLPSGRRRWRWGDVETWLRQRREGK